MNINSHWCRAIAPFSRAPALRVLQNAGGTFMYAVVLGVPVFVVLAVAAFGKPLFETNDDAAIAMLGSGFGMSAVGDAHLVFSHFGYGLIVRMVTVLVGPLAHGYLTLAALGLSIGLFARALYGSARKQSGWAESLLLIALGVVFLRPLLDPQFTITAALLFGAAIGCWLATSGAESRSPALSATIYAALILGFLLRPSSGLLGMVVVFPVLVWLAWLGPSDTRWPSRRLVATLAAIALLTYATDHVAYAYSPAWHDVQEYNHIQSLFIDFLRVPWNANHSAYRDAGWSANDHAMFLAWYSIDPIYDLDVIKHLASGAHTPLLILSGIPKWLNAAWQSPFVRAMTITQILSCVLLPRHRLLAALLLTGCVAATIIVGLSGRPPAPRVLYSTAGIAVLCTLPLILALEAVPRWRALASIALIAVVAVYSGSTAIAEHLQRVREADAYRAKLADAKPHLSGKLVAWGSALAFEWLITPTAIYSPFPNVTMVPIGGFSRTPVARAVLKDLGIADLSSALCTAPDVHLISIPNNVKMLDTFCVEHLQIRPIYDLVFDNGGTQIFVSRPPEPKP